MSKRASPTADKDGGASDEIAASEPQAKRYRTSFSDTVTVLAGEDRVPFTIHKHTICERSVFSSVACKPEWLQNGEDEKAVPLPEIRPDTFTLYAHWAYTGEIDTSILDDETNAILSIHGEVDWAANIKDCVAYLMHLVELHIAASFLGDLYLKKRTMDVVIEQLEIPPASFYVSPAHLNSIWTRTGPDSGLRKVIVDFLISSGYRQVLAEVHESVVPEVFYDLAMRQLGFGDDDFVRNYMRPQLQDKRWYYESDSGSSEEDDDDYEGDSDSSVERSGEDEEDDEEDEEDDPTELTELGPILRMRVNPTTQ